MLHTSLRVIHQTDRFTVTKFGWGAVYVVEKLSASGMTTEVRAFDGLAAHKFEQDWSATIARSTNTRPIAEPFAVDNFLASLF